MCLLLAGCAGSSLLCGLFSSCGKQGLLSFIYYLFQLEDNYFTILWRFCRRSARSDPGHTRVPSILSPSPASLPNPSLWLSETIRFGRPASCITLLLAVSRTVACMFQCCSLTSSHPLLFNWVQKSVLHVCVSFAALPVGSSVPSFWILLLQAAGCRACECHWLRFPGLWSPAQVVVRGLSHRGMWNLSRSGIKPLSPALAGGFFTTEPPGKP